MAASSYSVTLHHLSPDATAAGLAYPDVQLPEVNTAQLRDLLLALSEVAARLTIYEPSAPEIQIKTDREVFVVRTRYRRLCFVGWETILRGENHSVSYILSTITGSAEPVKAASKGDRTTSFSPIASSVPPMRAGRVPRWAQIAVLAFLIIGFNATTLWLLLRPAPTLTPRFELLPEPESRALLAKAAGEYETGAQEGDRRLVISSDGTLRLAKIGAQRSITEERTKTSRGVLVGGRSALITSDASLLEIKDGDTVILYGSTYRRHSP
jgi:hypothetical protein